MTDEEIKEHSKIVQAFTKNLKYRLNTINMNKISQIKEAVKDSNKEFLVPFDIATYESMMMARMSVIKSDMTKRHVDQHVSTKAIKLPIQDIIGWIEVTHRRLVKLTNTRRYIDYRQYKKYRKKDKNGIIESNYKLVYKLQTDLVNKEIDYIVALYRKLPSYLADVNKERNHD